MTKTVKNINEFMECAINIFKKKSALANKPTEPNKLNFHPYDFYISGHSAEFAFNLARFAKDNGIDASVTVMSRTEHNNETNTKISRVTSHFVVEANGKSFDIGGSDARMSWYNVMNYINQHRDKNIVDKWDFEVISLEDEQAAYDRIKRICIAEDFYFDDDLINKDKLIFSSILEKKPENELKM